MHAADMMNDFVVEVRPDDSILSAARAMRGEGVGLVCVCEPSHVPVGVLTDRDITVRASAQNAAPQETKVQEVMTAGPITCGLDASASEVERLMAQHAIGRVLVVDEHGLVAGVISLAEIWHHESPLTAGPVSRRITQHQLRVQSLGSRHDPSSVIPSAPTSEQAGPRQGPRDQWTAPRNRS